MLDFPVKIKSFPLANDSYPACLGEGWACLEIDKKLRERREIPTKNKIGISLVSLFVCHCGDSFDLSSIYLHQILFQEKIGGV